MGGVEQCEIFARYGVRTKARRDAASLPANVTHCAIEGREMLRSVQVTVTEACLESHPFPLRVPYAWTLHFANLLQGRGGKLPMQAHAYVRRTLVP